MSISLRI